MKSLTKYLGLFILLIAFGCNQNSEHASQAMYESELAPPPPATQQTNAENIERKLIKEGIVEFETNDLKATRKTVFADVDKFKAYVSSDQEYNAPGRKSNTIVVRIPANNFDNFLKEATQGVEKFDSKEINVKDVTEEFLDVQARLKTKKELEKRYLDLLKQAKNVTEILEIEKQIGQLRAEIESVEGRLKYLQNKVSFSTLTMTFYERLPNQTEFGQKFKHGLRNGWENLIWFLVGLVNIWPFIIVVLGLIIGIRMYRKNKKD